ncbi:hypothetical protein J2T15_004208 [Paenibacillus harenae]|uniref:Uncharacterized protein n=1 Tax=Paenibacillus harenae TaxID=306543 RepID=A0ABT9U541_PAEHA|nr:hypothetical protein [Paenibacillus harenae]
MVISHTHVNCTNCNGKGETTDIADARCTDSNRFIAYHGGIVLIGRTRCIPCNRVRIRGTNGVILLQFLQRYLD